MLLSSVLPRLQRKIIFLHTNICTVTFLCLHLFTIKKRDMTRKDFKSFVKDNFNGMKIRFSEKTQGTSFEAGGKILSAFIKVGWDYELSDELYGRCVENNISTGSVNSDLRLTLLMD